MPKILINEIDNTSAGTPGSYGNYAVLLTGYQQTSYTEKELENGLNEKHAENRSKLKDANDVYEFSSKQDFLDTIGETGVEKKDNQGNAVEYHYGNRMAIHLLDLGYTVIYKVINQVSEMDDENFWAIFKDKASYDFRFVSHGMLETCYDASAHSEIFNRLEQIREDISELERIKKSEVPEVKIDELEVNDLIKCDTQYQKLRTEYPRRFLDNAGTQYSTYSLAVGYDEDGNFVEDSGLYGDLLSQSDEFENHNNTHFTITIFNNINGHIARLATYRKDDPATIPGRGDCIALIELDEDIYCEADATKRPEKLIIEGIDAMSSITSNEGPYCAMTIPSVYYKINGTPTKFPGAFHYLACFMNSLNSGFAEWYAAAGYSRGVSSYVVDHTSVKLGEIAINALEPRNRKTGDPKFACNVIANFRGSYYLWGNRTAAELKSADAADGDLTAKHFLNIRQLCATIKKQLYVSCRRFTFDPNSDTLWINFVNAITPTLDAMKADQGISDYKIVKEFTDKKATLKAKIRIIPIEAVEDFDITVSLEDSFGGVSVTAEG
jgi:hypothetical protein